MKKSTASSADSAQGQGSVEPSRVRIAGGLFSQGGGISFERHTSSMSVSRSEAGIATIEGRLTSPIARVPEAAAACGGIAVKGRTLKTFAATTDVAVARNCNADALFAVYPFTGEPVITQALMTVAQRPLFVGVGGGTTTGQRVVELAMIAEMQGAAGVVINAPAPAETIEAVMSMVDIPVVATVLSDDELVDAKIAAGAAIVNVAAGAATPAVVAGIRARYADMPILASGGAKESSIAATIAAGADAVTWTPPSAQQIQSQMMDRYRAES